MYNWFSCFTLPLLLFLLRRRNMQSYRIYTTKSMYHLTKSPCRVIMTIKITYPKISLAIAFTLSTSISTTFTSAADDGSTGKQNPDHFSDFPD